MSPRFEQFRRLLKDMAIAGDSDAAQEMMVFLRDWLAALEAKLDGKVDR